MDRLVEKANSDILGEKLCWVCISQSKDDDESSGTMDKARQYFWPCLLFRNIDSYYQYYCCSDRNDVNAAASKKDVLSLASKILEKMADELMTGFDGEAENAESDDAKMTPTSTSKHQTGAMIAKMLGRGADDYLEIAMDDAVECVTDFSTHMVLHIKNQTNPAAFSCAVGDGRIVDDDSAVLYLDFMKAVDDAQYVLKTGLHPTLETAITSGKFYSQAMATLKALREKTKNGRSYKSAALTSQPQIGAAFPTSTDPPFATNNGTSPTREVNTQATKADEDSMETEFEKDAKLIPQSGKSTFHNIEPEIKPTDSFDETIRKLELAGWHNIYDEASNQRVYASPDSSQRYTKSHLCQYLRNTYGWKNMVETDKDDTVSTTPLGPAKNVAAKTKSPKKATKKTNETQNKSKSTGSSTTPKTVTATKKARKTKPSCASPGRMFQTPQPKEGEIGRRSIRVKTPTGTAIELSGGKLPSYSDYVKQSYLKKASQLEQYKSEEEAKFYNFRNLMDILKRHGWRYVHHPLKDHTYVRVGGKAYNKGGKHKEDYFHEEREVIDYCKAHDYYGRRHELGLVSPQSSSASSSSKSSSSTTKRKQGKTGVCTP
jgi:hypothetical protein